MHKSSPVSSRGPKLLATARQSAVILERARVYVEGGRVVYQVAENGHRKTYNLPFANIAVLFLGQGTSITSEAGRLLAEEGVFISMTGTGGTPLHFGAMSAFETTRHMWKMIEVARDPDLSLQAALIIMRARIEAFSRITPNLTKELFKGGFPKKDVEAAQKRFRRDLEGARTTQELMAYEGQFAKSLFAAFARFAGIRSFERKHGMKKHDTEEARANSQIDHGNYLAYGIAGAALWTHGIPRGLSVLHGKTRNGGLVLDLADSFKDALVLPLAFAPHETDQEFRQAAIAAIQDHEILKRSIEVLHEILALGQAANTARLEALSVSEDKQE